MFTVEIKINGALIGALYGHNNGPMTPSEMPDGYHSYTFNYWDPASATTTPGSILHARKLGILPLLRGIFERIEAINDKNSRGKVEKAVEERRG